MGYGVSKSGASIVYTTVTDTLIAKRIVQNIVSKGMAACVKFMERVDSVYMQDGAMQADTEVLMAIETVDSKLEDIPRELKKMHPYDIPMIWTVVVDRINESGARWIEKEMGVLLSAHGIIYKEASDV